MLFGTFQRRSSVSAANESVCRDQNVDLLDHLRANYPANFDVTEAAANLIDFMVHLEFLQTKTSSLPVQVMFPVHHFS